MKDTLRPYQAKAMSAALAHLKNHKVFRFDICVGGGKTTTSIHTATKLVGPKGKIVVACHTTILRDQFEANAKDQLEKTPKNWEFYTFQTLRNKTIEDIPNIDLLIIDESHQGGQSDGGSYATIIKNLNPKKILALSATDSGVSEELFGKKTKANTFTFSFLDAKKAGVLNNCDLFTIHTGLEQRLEGLDSRTISGDDIGEIQKQDLELGVDLSNEESVNAINSANIKAAIKTYLTVEAKPEAGIFPSAVFYVNRIPLADECLKLFIEEYAKIMLKAGQKKFSSGESIVRASHSEMEYNTNVADFKAKKFPVLINIRQIQEGFDDPSLETVFDCSPSFSNGQRIFIQRLGRVLRTKLGKAVSRYYTFYKSTGRVSDYNTSDLVPELSDTVTVAHQQAIEASVRNQCEAELAGYNVDTNLAMAEVLENNDLTIEVPGVDDITVIPIEPDFYEADDSLISVVAGDKPSSIMVVKANYIVVGAKGHKTTNSRNLHEILSVGTAHDPDGTKQKIRDFHAKMGKFPYRRSKDKEERRLASNNMGYCSPSSHNYDPIHHLWAKANGYGTDTKRDNQAKLRDFFAEHGHFPSSRTKEAGGLGFRHTNYCNPNSNTYDPEYLSWATSVGYVVDRAGRNKLLLKEFHAKYAGFPRQGDKDNKKLANNHGAYCNPNSSAYDPEYHDWAVSVGYVKRKPKNKKKAI